MGMLLSSASCHDDDDLAVSHPVLKLSLKEAGENVLQIEVAAKDAAQVAYVFSTEGTIPATAEAIWGEGQKIKADETMIRLEGLAPDTEYTVRAIAVCDMCSEPVFSAVEELRARTAPLSRFELKASTQFGCKPDELAEAECKTGREVGGYDPKTHTLQVKTADGEQPEVTYYFDRDDRYVYALVSLAFEGSMQEYSSKIREAGWSEYKPAMEWEEILSKDGLLLRFFSGKSDAQEEPALFVGRVDEDVLSWTRLDDLTDAATGLSVPLVALGGSLDLITKYEFYQGHTVNPDRTNPKRQFYAFDTGNEKFPMTGYWMDIQTNTCLEECALYVREENRPTPAEVDKYLTSLGFFFTNMGDKTGNPIYYRKESMTVCCPEMINPNDGPFAPKLRFYIQNLEEYLPQETVDIPWPNTDFDKITMTEAVAWYEAKGYTVDPKGFADVFPLVKTTSKDFPTIVLLPSDKDETIYFGASVMTENERVIRSFDVERQLLEHGFKKVDSDFLPTYENAALNVSAQVDNSGMFGLFSIGFNPIGA